MAQSQGSVSVWCEHHFSSSSIHRGNAFWYMIPFPKAKYSYVCITSGMLIWFLYITFSSWYVQRQHHGPTIFLAGGGSSIVKPKFFLPDAQWGHTEQNLEFVARAKQGVGAVHAQKTQTPHSGFQGRVFKGSVRGSCGVPNQLVLDSRISWHQGEISSIVSLLALTEPNLRDFGQQFSSGGDLVSVKTT